MSPNSNGAATAVEEKKAKEEEKKEEKKPLKFLFVSSSLALVRCIAMNYALYSLINRAKVPVD